MYRQRLEALEDLVGRVCMAQGIDPESMLAEPDDNSKGSARQESTGSTSTTTDAASTTSSTSTTSTSTASTSTASAGVVLMEAVAEQEMTEEQKLENIKSKLRRLTGRKMSLEEIGPLLHARNPDEALRNGRMLRTAEHLKRVYGTRPGAYVRAANSADTGTRHKRKSLSSVDLSELMPGGSSSHSGSAHNSDAGLVAAASAEQAGEGLKMEKLTRLTGRRGSLSEIRSLLLPSTVEEARQYAQSLYTLEKLKKRYGERPAVERAVAQPPPQK